MSIKYFQAHSFTGAKINTQRLLMYTHKCNICVIGRFGAVECANFIVQLPQSIQHPNRVFKALRTEAEAVGKILRFS